MDPYPAPWARAALRMTVAVAAMLPVSASAQEPGQVHPRSMHAAGIAIPTAMKTEHDAIHQQLVRASQAPGRTGEAARALARVLHPHFVREEQIALPPLGLLAPLGRGEFTSAMTAVLPMTDSLKAELPRMLEEHSTIHAATARLGEVARVESNAEAAELAATLAGHAEAEEQLFYPAALLVGEVVRARAAADHH